MDFADDIVLLPWLDEETRRVGLKINKEKTKAMRINARNQQKIIINGQDIEDVDEFVCLGAKVCKEGGAVLRT